MSTVAPPLLGANKFLLVSSSNKMLSGLVALSTWNRLTSAVLDGSRLVFIPLSFLESFCEVAALSSFGSISRFRDEKQRRRFSVFGIGNASRPKYPEISSQILFQKSQALSSARLSAVETTENGDGNQNTSEFGSDVVHLSENNFDDFIKGTPLVAVLYHAAWCQTCRILKPVWRSVSKEIAIEKYPAALAAVDITANPELGIREKISHLPSVKLYSGGQFLGNVPTPIAHKDLVEILKNPMQTIKVQTDEHDAVSEGDAPSIEALEQLKIVAEEIEDKTHKSACEVCCDDNAKICTQLGVYAETIPHLRYFHFLMRKQIYYSGDFTSASMLAFLRTAASAAGQDSGSGTPDPDSSRLWRHVPDHDHVILLNDATFDRAIEIQPQLLVMFYAAWCRHCAIIKPIYAEAAAELSKLGYPKRLAACELVANSRVSQVQSIEFVPSFRLFEQGKPVSDHHSLRTKEEFIRLIVERNKNKM